MSEMSELNDTGTLDEESLAERLERLKRGSLGGLRIFIRLAALRQQALSNTHQLDDLPNRRFCVVPAGDSAGFWARHFSTDGPPSPPNLNRIAAQSEAFEAELVKLSRRRSLGGSRAMRCAFNDLASYLALVLIPSLRATLDSSAGPITCSLTEAWTAYLRSKPLLIRRVRSGKKHDLDVAILPAISAVFYLTSTNPFSKEEPCLPY